MRKSFYIFILTILILACKINASQYTLSICAVFQNEAPYFKEWIEFHKLQGVEHFFLYNNNSDDDYLTELLPYINSHEVTLDDWPYDHHGDALGWESIQPPLYTDCIQKYGPMTKWLAIIDLDEFLFCPDGQDLPTFLIDYEEYGGVCVNWRMFGTSHLETIPSDLLMIEALTHCSIPKHKRNKQIKSIVQPKYVTKVQDAHCFHYIDNYFAITSDGQEASSTSFHSKKWSNDKIRINHYWTRTESFFREIKLARRKRCGHCGNEKKYWELASSFNKCTDTAILQFVPALREILGYD